MYIFLSGGKIQFNWMWKSKEVCFNLKWYNWTGKISWSIGHPIHHARWQVEIKIMTFGKMLPSVFFSPTLFFFVRRWGSTIFNVQYLPFTVKCLCSLVRCSTPNGGCSSRGKSDYLKENTHCSKDQWLFQAHWILSGGDSKAQLFTLSPLTSTPSSVPRGKRKASAEEIPETCSL